MRCIGIDVSKISFTVAYPTENAYRLEIFKNENKGIRMFITTLHEDNYHCVLEATGTYSTLLVYLLQEAQIAVSMVNPKQINHFAKMMLSVTKTDNLDAKLIALYGEKMKPDIYKMPSLTIQGLRQKRTLLRQFKKQLRMLLNVQKSFLALPKVDNTANKALKKSIAFIEKQIQELNLDMVAVTRAQFSTQLDHLTSIKGIGNGVATALIMATGGFEYFDSAKKFAKYIGVFPSYQQSGTSIKTKGFITRHGDPETSLATLYCHLVSNPI
ncbi:IS110 family transposase [Sphingobacterium sp. SG20118]|uniref:IS110 family transposase n=1 Tax=Sphingobacterium sp. SG20118 TaxID=3367156 RepID=UPI0037DFC40F